MLQLTKQDLRKLDRIIESIDNKEGEKNYAQYYKELNKIAIREKEYSIAAYFHLAEGINGNTGKSAEVIRGFLRKQGLSEEEIQKISNNFSKGLHNYIERNDGRIESAGVLYALDKGYFREIIGKHPTDFGRVVDPITHEVIYIGLDDYLHFVFIMMDAVNSTIYQFKLVRNLNIYSYQALISFANNFTNMLESFFAAIITAENDKIPAGISINIPFSAIGLPFSPHILIPFERTSKEVVNSMVMTFFEGLSLTIDAFFAGSVLDITRKMLVSYQDNLVKDAVKRMVRETGEKKLGDKQNKSMDKEVRQVFLDALIKAELQILYVGSIINKKSP